MDIQNAKYTNQELTQISAEVDGVKQFIPLGSDIHNFIVEEEIVIASYEARDITIEEVRAKRNQLLAETDCYFLYGNAAPVPSGIVKDDIKTYRDALRDITEGLNLTGIKQIGAINWPIKPF
jgi:hypothetical protein